MSTQAVQRSVQYTKRGYQREDAGGPADNGVHDSDVTYSTHVAYYSLRVLTGVVNSLFVRYGLLAEAVSRRQSSLSAAKPASSSFRAPERFAIGLRRVG